MCGLDGFPATACPENVNGSYAYWSYFNGAGGGWSYGRDNPFARRVKDGEILGWRYTTGSPDGQAPTPRIAPSASLFPAVALPAPPPPPPPPPAPSAPNTVPPAPPALGPPAFPGLAAPSGGRGSGGAGTAGGTPSTGGAPSTTAATPTPDPSKAPPADPNSGPATGPDADPGAPDSIATTVPTDTDANTGRGSPLGAGSEELAAGRTSSGADAGRWIGVAVAGVVVLALIGGGVLRTRSRARSRP